MARIDDKTGRRYGHLTVRAFAGTDLHGSALWRCRCECGRTSVVRSCNLASGNTQSCGRCGAAWQSQGRHYHTPTYRSWNAMIQRCLNPRRQEYRFYGARGVTVCASWRDYQNFLHDMGERPEGMTLDRKDPYGNYEPGNCRWATPVQQANNKRSHHAIRQSLVLLRRWLDGAAAQAGVQVAAPRPLAAVPVSRAASRSRGRRGLVAAAA